MANRHHTTLLNRIKENAGRATQHTYADNYLGTTNFRYAISVPTLRLVAKEWMKEHSSLTRDELTATITALMKGKSSTEKTMGGLLLDYSSPEQRKFDPVIFEEWLSELTGWAEVDALTSGDYSKNEIASNFKAWKKILVRLSKSKNIHHRRASLVFLVVPLRADENEALAAIALENIERLKGEKEILITKAISWLLRSMIRHYRGMVQEYVDENAETLPAIAVRETRTKLKTGTKTKRKKNVM